MPLLWFVYPLNGSGRRNPDAADRGQNHFSSISSTFRGPYLRQPTSRLIVPLARPNSVCLGAGAGVDIERELAQRPERRLFKNYTDQKTYRSRGQRFRRLI